MSIEFRSTVTIKIDMIGRTADSREQYIKELKADFEEDHGIELRDEEIEITEPLFQKL